MPVLLGAKLQFIIGLLAFFARASNYTLFCISFFITIIATLSLWIHPIFMFVRSTISVTQPKIFITITGWMIDKILLIIIGLLTVGWKGLLYYAGGYILATLIGYVLNIFLAKSNLSQFGVFLQSDEKAFIFLSLRNMEKVSFMDWIKAYNNYLNSEG